MDASDPDGDVAALLDSLALCEHAVRRYRTRGDASYEDGRHRAATEYHILASQENARIQELAARLTELLGPDGGPGLPVADVLRQAAAQASMLARIQDVDSFEDACFFRRHPRWAQFSDRFREAHRRWFDEPALAAMAPAYHPLWPGWTD